MNFLDQAKIFVSSGAGGPGCISFRREANIEYGGPDGGNGGRGGSIIVRATRDENTLVAFRFKQHFRAQRGHHGMGRTRAGAAGEDLILSVPIGTQVWDADRTVLLHDLVKEGDEMILARGGRGGAGNAVFKSSINRAPRTAGLGEPAQEMWVWLLLKLLADVGLIGLPNAGKSTLLSRMTRATPKIADYPFTTLHPQLGVSLLDDHEIVLADLPGLIEGAHEGRGIGHRFLGHAERCSHLVHVIDATIDDPKTAYDTVRNELSSYLPALAEKEEVVVLNKCDLLTEEERLQARDTFGKISAGPLFIVSGATGEGLSTLLSYLHKTCSAECHKSSF